MKRYEYRGMHLTINELADMFGVPQHTLRDRLRRGYSVEQATALTPLTDSIQDFVAHSMWTDWIGMPMSDLYKIYWKWCVSHKYPVMSKQGFSRQLFNIYPNLYCVPMKGVRYIRERK